MAVTRQDTSTGSPAEHERALLHTTANKIHQILRELSKCHYNQMHESRLAKLQEQEEKGLPSEEKLNTTRPVTVRD